MILYGTRDQMAPRSYCTYHTSPLSCCTGYSMYYCTTVSMQMQGISMQGELFDYSKYVLSYSMILV